MRGFAAAGLCALVPGLAPPPQGGAASRPDGAEALARAVLQRLSGGRPAALDGVRLTCLRERKVEDPRRGRVRFEPTARWQLSLARRPMRLRMEWLEDGRRPTVFLFDGKDAWAGPAGGPFVRLDAGGRARLLARLRLFGALAGWDLFGGEHRSRGRLLVTAQAPLPGRPTVKRRLAAGGRTVALILPEGEYLLEGEAPATGGRWPQFVTGPTERFRLERCATDFAFRPRHFDPQAGGGGRPLLVGGEQRNYRVPLLERLPASWQIDFRDPGNWRERVRLLDRVGRKLHELGMAPSSLPLFRADGRVLLQFRPEDPKRRVPSEGPEGSHPVQRPERLALVLYVKAAWREAAAELERRLRARADELGLRPAGQLLLVPLWLPQPGRPLPGPKTVLEFRGELEVR